LGCLRRGGRGTAGGEDYQSGQDDRNDGIDFVFHALLLYFQTDIFNQTESLFVFEPMVFAFNASFLALFWVFFNANAPKNTLKKKLFSTVIDTPEAGWRGLFAVAAPGDEHQYG